MRFVQRAAMVVAVLAAGWALGTVSGIVVAFVWNAIAGEADVSPVIAVPVGGLIGVLVAAIWGFPLVIRRS